MPNDSVSNLFRNFGALLGVEAPEERLQDDHLWREEPPQFETFITSEQYLKLPPLSQRQLQALQHGFGRGGRDLFVLDKGSNRYHENVYVWGKGSGKDYLSSIAISYLSYVLLCMTDPSTMLGLAPGEHLDILNVATNAYQAKQVFFAKLSERLKRPCFAKFGPRIKQQMVEFMDSPVKLHSLHAQEQSWEGFNVIGWVMDEADAFETAASGASNAEAVHGVLTSSATSRFPDWRWIGFIISYPRSELGFLLPHKEHCKKYNSAYVDEGYTWDIHPFYDPDHPSFKNFPWVEVNGYTVPEPFEDDFRRDPEGSAMKYMCKPPAVQGAFITFPARIADCQNPQLEPVYYAEPSVTTHRFEHENPFGEDPTVPEELFAEERNFVALELSDLVHEPEEGVEYYIHCDPGETTDSFALCMGHALPETLTIQPFGGEETTVQRVRIDLLLEWKPTPGMPVDMLNAQDIIILLCSVFPVAKVTFDKFQSAQVMQTLLALGIPALQMSFARTLQMDMFTALKDGIYSRAIEWPACYQEQIDYQLRYLKRKGSQVTHDVAPKDLADALAAVYWNASGAGMTPLERLAQGSLPGGNYGMRAGRQKGRPSYKVLTRRGAAW